MKKALSKLLKYLLAIFMIAIGILGASYAFIGCTASKIGRRILRLDMPGWPYWIIGIIALCILAGGIYLLSKKH